MTEIRDALIDYRNQLVIRLDNMADDTEEHRAMRQVRQYDLSLFDHMLSSHSVLCGED